MSLYPRKVEGGEAAEQKLRPVHHDPVTRGPMPMIATINAELKLTEDTLSEYYLRSQMGANALIPMYLEILVEKIAGEDIPELFAKAYDLPHAPLTRDVREGITDELPGLFYLLPTPLKLGIAAIAIRELRFLDHYSSRLAWNIRRIEVLATEPQTLVEQAPRDAFTWASRSSDLKEHPDDPRTRAHMSYVGDIVTTIPKLTIDKEMQDMFEASIHARANAPEISLDRREELVEGIIEIYQMDGLSVRGNLDQLIAHDFAVAAKDLTLDPALGKGLFTRLLRYKANSELERLAQTTVTQHHQERTKKLLLGAIDAIADRTGSDLLFDTHGSSYRYQVALDFDTARELARSIIVGRLKIPGVGKAGVEVLKHLFESLDE